MTALVVPDVVALDLWPGIRLLVDVGGGSGTLAAAVARAHPHVQAAVLDRGDAESAALQTFEAEGVMHRCRFVAGDFFQAVPSGMDCYLLKSILHNWDDAACAHILHRCAQAAPAGATLLLVERMLPQRLRGVRRDAALARTDLNMLAGLGGRERTRAAYERLLHDAGFEPAALRSTGFEFSVLEARRR